MLAIEQEEIQDHPSPRDGSKEDQADVQETIEAQKFRTKAQTDEANTDAPYSTGLFYPVIGVDVTPTAYPVTYLFFERFQRQVGQFVGELKDHWKRPRPFVNHPDIPALFGVSGYSYPSGHATLSYATAVMLGQLFPDKTQALLDRARKIALSRVDAGVHYPSDVKEGERLGREVAARLLTAPAFVAEMKAAKAELEKK